MFFGLLPPGASYLDILYYTLTSSAAGIALALVTAVTVPLLVLIPLQLNRISYAPKNIPWVGQGSNTWWSKLKSTLLALKFERRNLEEGWEKVRRLAWHFSFLSWTLMITNYYSTAAKAGHSSGPRSIGPLSSCHLSTQSGLLNSPSTSSRRPKCKTKSWVSNGLLPDRVTLSFTISRLSGEN
jgi:hypothetical protein